MVVVGTPDADEFAACIREHGAPDQPTASGSLADQTRRELAEADRYVTDLSRIWCALLDAETERVDLTRLTHGRRANNVIGVGPWDMPVTLLAAADLAEVLAVERDLRRGQDPD